MPGAGGIGSRPNPVQIPKITSPLVKMFDENVQAFVKSGVKSGDDQQLSGIFTLFNSRINVGLKNADQRQFLPVMAQGLHTLSAALGKAGTPLGQITGEKSAPLIQTARTIVTEGLQKAGGNEELKALLQGMLADLGGASETVSMPAPVKKGPEAIQSQTGSAPKFVDTAEHDHYMRSQITFVSPSQSGAAPTQSAPSKTDSKIGAMFQKATGAPLPPAAEKLVLAFEHALSDSTPKTLKTVLTHGSFFNSEGSLGSEPDMSYIMSQLTRTLPQGLDTLGSAIGYSALNQVFNCCQAVLTESIVDRSCPDYGTFKSYLAAHSGDLEVQFLLDTVNDPGKLQVHGTAVTEFAARMGIDIYSEKNLNFSSVFLSHAQSLDRPDLSQIGAAKPAADADVVAADDIEDWVGHLPVDDEERISEDTILEFFSDSQHQTLAYLVAMQNALDAFSWNITPSHSKAANEATILGYSYDFSVNSTLRKLSSEEGSRQVSVADGLRAMFTSVKLAAAMNSLPDTTKPEVYRSLKFDTPEAQRAFIQQFLPEGTTMEACMGHDIQTVDYGSFTDPGYVSTTKDRSITVNGTHLTGGYQIVGENMVRLVIHNPGDAGFKDISDLSHWTAQKEVLGLPGMPMQVTSMAMVDGAIEVHVTAGGE